ncbi:hypothetical protein BH10PSE4_BH10PSE4_02680 [soil metagenome]
MRLTQAMGGWALVDDDRRQLAAIAGGLGAWAPRLVGGEGPAALPIVGRYQAFQSLGGLEPIEPSQGLRRLFWATEHRGETAIAVVLGAPVQYRPDPTRCVLGYVHVAKTSGPGPVTLGPVLVSPSALDDAGSGRAADVVAAQLEIGRCLAQLDACHSLQTGDVILMDSPSLSPGQLDLLLALDVHEAIETAAPRLAPVAIYA